MIYYALLEPTEFLSNPIDYLLFALARFGSNGDGYPAPEIACGGPSEEDASYARAAWDADLSDGFASGDVSVALNADLSDGLASWDVDADGADPVSYSLPDGETVGSVRVAAGTQVPGSVEWTDLTFTFYSGNVAQDSITISDGPSVDTTQSQSGVGEQVLVVTPDSTLYDRVSVTGTFRMEAGPDTYPAPSDLFGQILIIPHSA